VVKQGVEKKKSGGSGLWTVVSQSSWNGPERSGCRTVFPMACGRKSRLRLPESPIARLHGLIVTLALGKLKKSSSERHGAVTTIAYSARNAVMGR
jgi:hypothetical protein